MKSNQMTMILVCALFPKIMKAYFEHYTGVHNNNRKLLFNKKSEIRLIVQAAYIHLYIKRKSLIHSVSNS